MKFGFVWLSKQYIYTLRIIPLKWSGFRKNKKLQWDSNPRSLHGRWPFAGPYPGIPTRMIHTMCFLTHSCAWARFSKNLVASNTDTAWSKVFFSKIVQFNNFTYRHLSPIPCKNYKNVTNRLWILHSWYDRTCLYVPLIEILSEVRLISWNPRLIRGSLERKFSSVLTKASRKSSMSSTSIPYLSIICSLKWVFKLTQIRWPIRTHHELRKLIISSDLAKA